MKTQLKADMMLMVVTLCWGVSYFLMDVALQDMGAFTLNTYRFVGAFVIAGIIAFPKLKTVNKTTLKYSCLIGFALVFVYIGATFGVQHTTLSNSGFLCALTVVFIPLFEMIIFRKKQEGKLMISVLLCLVGIALLTLSDDFTINFGNLKGDLLCMGCAVAYAIDLMLTEKAVANKEVNAFQLGVFQLGFTGLFNLILCLIFEKPALPTQPNTIFAVVFLSVFCTGVAFIVQAVAQKYTKASHVGVIFSLEPVFASVTAFVFAGEILTTKSYIGACLMLISILVMEMDVKAMIKRRKERVTGKLIFEEMDDKDDE